MFAGFNGSNKLLADIYLSLSSLSLCTLQTTTPFSLSWPMLARSQVFNLRSALKLLSASQVDTGTTNNILISTSTWLNNPAPPLEASWRPLLPLHCCYRGICCKREATALKEIHVQLRVLSWSKRLPSWTSTPSNTKFCPIVIHCFPSKSSRVCLNGFNWFIRVNQRCCFLIQCRVFFFISLTPKGSALVQLNPARGDRLKQSVSRVGGSTRVGTLQPITFSAVRMIHCSLLLSLAVAAAYQMVMEEVRMDSMMAV